MLVSVASSDLVMCYKLDRVPNIGPSLCFHELVTHLKFSEPQFPFWKMGKLYLKELWKSTMIIWLKYNEYSVFLALVIYTKVIKIITERI